MTPADGETYARNKYNAVNDTFFTQAELLAYMTQACNEIALETKCIERVYTTTSVQGVREIVYPTNTVEVKRVEYAGKKLTKLSFTEDDILTQYNANTTDQGTPVAYEDFNYTIFLRNIPAVTGDTIKVFSINLPAALTILSSIEIPVIFHYYLLDYMVAQMAFKDQNYTAYNSKMEEWELKKLRAKAQWKRHIRGDRPAMVKDTDFLPNTYIGLR